MIYQAAVFLGMILGGGAAWFFLQYMIQYMQNVVMVEFPQYMGLPHVTFMIAFVNWGMLILCMIPALIYLWVNTQRPEVR